MQNCVFTCSCSRSCPLPSLGPILTIFGVDLVVSPPPFTATTRISYDSPGVRLVTFTQLCSVSRRVCFHGSSSLEPARNRDMFRQNGLDTALYKNLPFFSYLNQIEKVLLSKNADTKREFLCSVDITQNVEHTKQISI